MAADILTCTDLSKRFHKGRRTILAVDRVNLSVAAGESFGLVGGSGCGKSTLARLVTGLAEVDEGSVRLGSQEISSLKGRNPRHWYRSIQMVFQEPQASFNPRKSIGQSLMEVLSNFRIVEKAHLREAALKALQQVGLSPELADRLPGQLSGGQCQRAAIARAVAVKPQILVCDEVTSALDVSVQAQILNLLKRLRDESGMAFLFISHDLALVRSFCGRVGVMYDGQLVETGPADLIIHNPQHAHTRQLLASLFTLDSRNA